MNGGFSTFNLGNIINENAVGIKIPKIGSCAQTSSGIVTLERIQCISSLRNLMC